VIITGDEVRIKQALTNLVGNVARHTPAGTPCEIELTHDGGMATVAVIDHGPGVSPDAEQK